MEPETEDSSLDVRAIPFPGFNKARGFTTADMHNAAEELRMEGNGSEDPMYENQQKNR